MYTKLEELKTKLESVIALPIIIDFPSSERGDAIYITPDSAEITSISLNVDEVKASVKVYIVSKRKSRAIFDAFNTIYGALREMTEVSGFDYYAEDGVLIINAAIDYELMF